MNDNVSFGEVLEAAGKLPLNEQEMLMEILHRRMIERRREELANDLRDARKEFSEGGCQPATPDEIMSEILTVGTHDEVY